MPLLLKALAEMFGTFVIIFIGGSSVLLSEKAPHVFPPFGISITFGCVVTLMILFFAHWSGAHFNPAVTLAFALTKRFPASQIALYWISQLTGGLAAAGLLTLMNRT